MISLSSGGSVLDAVDDADADATNEIQALSKDGNMIMLSEGGSVVDAVDDADADATNEIQTLSKDGSMIMLSNGGGSVMDAVDDADADASNEIQQLSISGSTLSISNGNSVEIPGGSDADADPANEIQSLSKSGNVISLSKGGGMITDAVDDADASPTNELQDLSLLALADAGIDGATVYQLELSNSGSVVDLPYNEWWQASILLIDPPQVGNIFTNYPTVINNTLDAQTVVAPVIETTDITVGEPTTLATHIQAEGIHWDGGGLSDDLGFFLERDEIRYGVTLPSTDFQMKLNKKELQFVNGGGWQSTYLGGESTGILQLFPGGGTPAYLTTGLTSSGSGNLNIYGSNGNINIWNTHLAGVPNGGYLSVNDDGGLQQAGVYVDAGGQGIVWGDMKTFVMPHPKDKDKEIQYVSLEGPEAGAYERGTAKLINGEAIVEFSEHFSHVIGRKNMTVMITPLSAESKGIAVIEKGENGFKVKELLKGNGTYEFDWEVKAVRAGYEDFEVVRKKLEIYDNTKVKRVNTGKN